MKDVVWDRNRRHDRRLLWHTMLVAGFGANAPGYYAIDVTNPDPTGWWAAGYRPIPDSPGRSSAGS